MRRHVLIIGLLISQIPCATLTLHAQETPPAAPVAALDTDENYKALNARMEDLATSNEVLTKNLNKMRDEVLKLSTEVERANDKNKDSATMESIKALKSAIEEVDKKRIEDQKLVLEKLEALKVLITKAPPVTRTPTPPTNVSVLPRTTSRTNPPAQIKPEDNRSEKGYNYSIQDGDILPKIVSRLNAQGLKVTQKQIMDANPGVNWNRLQIGKVIFIPAPAQ
jgi:hypothetical protein